MVIKTIMTMLAAMFCAVIFAQDNGEYAANYAREPRFKALLHYEPHAEEAHVQFDKQAIEFFHKLTYGEGWTMDVTTSLADYLYDKLKEYCILISLNVVPVGAAQREAFKKYMENGRGWIGFHASAYNDRNTEWPWLNNFLGCGPFYCNNWLPQPALVECDTQEHPVTISLPASFVVPASTQNLLFVNAFRWVVSCDPKGDPFKK